MKRKLGPISVILFGASVVPSMSAHAGLSGCGSQYAGGQTIVQARCTSYYNPPIKPDSYRARGRVIAGGAWVNGPWKAPAVWSEVAVPAGYSAFVDKSIQQL